MIDVFDYTANDFVFGDVEGDMYTSDGSLGDKMGRMCMEISST
jgi:hypothetical protein